MADSSLALGPRTQCAARMKSGAEIERSRISAMPLTAPEKQRDSRIVPDSDIGLCRNSPTKRTVLVVFLLHISDQALYGACVGACVTSVRATSDRRNRFRQSASGIPNHLSCEV